MLKASKTTLCSNFLLLLSLLLFQHVAMAAQPIVLTQGQVCDAVHAHDAKIAFISKNIIAPIEGLVLPVNFRERVRESSDVSSKAPADGEHMGLRDNMLILPQIDQPHCWYINEPEVDPIRSKKLSGTKVCGTTAHMPNPRAFLLEDKAVYDLQPVYSLTQAQISEALIDAQGAMNMPSCISTTHQFLQVNPFEHVMRLRWDKKVELCRAHLRARCEKLGQEFEALNNAPLDPEYIQEHVQNMHRAARSIRAMSPDTLMQIVHAEVQAQRVAVAHVYRRICKLALKGAEDALDQMDHNNPEHAKTLTRLLDKYGAYQ